jgi:hypothetical protein
MTGFRQLFADVRMPLRLTIATTMVDIHTEWTPSRLLTKSSGLSASSQSGTLDRCAQATSRLRIENMTRCSRTARGFAFGSSTAFAAGLKLQSCDYRIGPEGLLERESGFQVWDGCARWISIQASFGGRGGG